MGAGRTGTTILGQLIGSMKPVFFIFEPVLLRTMLPFLIKSRPLLEQAFLSTLFEDYLLPKVQGRRIDPNKDDKTCWVKYHTEAELLWRNKLLQNRGKAILWLNAENPFWLIKLPELQPMAPTLTRLFPGCALIHTVRDGREAVQSAVKLNWYNDEWINKMAVEWGLGPAACPWYMPKNIKSSWAGWNAETRAAAVWRITTAFGVRFEHYRIKLEDLQQNPQKVAIEFREILNLRLTNLTDKCVKTIERFASTKWKPYADPTEKIAESERSKFLALNKELGYV